ncbi:MAG: hypothetical protein LBM78_02415 [Clostridiales bacterium]|jgi:hypothetical protein|nr:hypothetical protein [Clostridiales bacterium]
MTFARTPLRVPRTHSAVVEVPGFAAGVRPDADPQTLPLRYGVTSYNLKFENGALKTGYGLARMGIIDPNSTLVKVPALGQGIKRVWRFPRRPSGLSSTAPRDYIVVWAAGGGLYYLAPHSQPAAWQQVPGLSLTYEPVIMPYVLDGTDVLIITGRTIPMYVFDGTAVQTVQMDMRVRAAALHAERMFVLHYNDESMVQFSDDFDPTNWTVSDTEGGFVSLTGAGGNPQVPVSFGDYLYLFRSYGIARLYGTGAQEGFSLAEVHTFTGRLFPRTVVRAGERIFFATTEGLFAFDGLNAVRVARELAGRLEPGNAVAAAYDGKYCLACRYDYGDGRTLGDEGANAVNNTLLMLDIRTGAWTMTRGPDIADLAAYENEMYHALLAVTRRSDNGLVYVLDGRGAYDGAPLPGVWKSPLSDLGAPHKPKAIRALTLTTQTDCTVTVRTEAAQKTLQIAGADAPRRVPVGIAGRLAEVTIEVAGGGAVRVAHPLLEVAG